MVLNRIAEQVHTHTHAHTHQCITLFWGWTRKVNGLKAHSVSWCVSQTNGLLPSTVPPTSAAHSLIPSPVQPLSLFPSSHIYSTQSCLCAPNLSIYSPPTLTEPFLFLGHKPRWRGREAEKQNHQDRPRMRFQLLCTEPRMSICSCEIFCCVI